MQLYRALSICILMIFFVSCNQNGDADTRDLPVGDDHTISITAKYAEGFTISAGNGFRHLKVFSPWKRAKDTLQYALVREGVSELQFPVSTVVVQTPVRSVVCLSTTHLAFIDILGLDSTLTGVAGTKWVNAPGIVDRITSGHIRDVGSDSHLNYELILELDPDVVFAYGIEGHSMAYLEKLKRFGVPVVMVSEYMETSPLGKAEWIKFIAAFFEMERYADAKFREIEESYLSVREKAIMAKDKPTVFTGLPWKGDWFVPGGNSFQAALLKDAGADYLWSENQERSGMVVDIEVVFERALNADYWLNVNDFHEKSELLGLDERYAAFKAIKENHVYNNNKRQNASLGNDYWESGVVRPDLVLKDLVKIFHPALAGDHELYYYQQIN